ncbi:UDP-glycosyltransferase 91C1 [Linum perenne]
MVNRSSLCHTIFFIPTPRNIDSLPNIPPFLLSLITFVNFPLSPVEVRHPTAESTSDLGVNDVSYLKRAYDLLQQQLCHYLRSASPFIVCDYATFWLPSLARELGSPLIFFSPAYWGSRLVRNNSGYGRFEAETFRDGLELTIQRVLYLWERSIWTVL